MDSFFYHCPNLETFKILKLSSDNTNTTYFTYNSNVSTLGEPDVKWNQIVFVDDSSIIYTRGTIYSNYVKPEDGIPASDLDDSIFKLPGNYQKSSYTTSQELTILSYDEYKTAIGKLEKKLDDNISYVANSYTYLNNKIEQVNELPTVTSSDNGKILKVVNGQWQLVSPSTLYSGTGAPNDSQGHDGDIYVQTNEEQSNE